MMKKEGKLTQKNSKKIVLIGPPGSGKGTQASRIMEHFSIPHISSGDILRNEVRNGTDSIIVDRITDRRTCVKCSAIFSIKGNPPTADGKCDSCQGELIQRDDDNKETVQSRLSVYENQTRPVIEFYKEEGLLHEIDGEGNPDNIFQDILKIL